MPVDTRLVWVSFDEIGRDCMRVAAEAGARVVAVVTLPSTTDPKPSGWCEFDGAAAELGAEVIETTNVNAPETVERIRAAAPDMIFVVGWSQLVREDFIALAPRGVFGMHPTLLPKHRGRAPLPWAILSGLATTGVTLFEIVDPTADSGGIVGRAEVPIAPDETATTLFARVAEAHLELVRSLVPGLLEGTAPREVQDPKRASEWPKRRPRDGLIDWDTRAPYLYDWVRAQTRPYPGAFTYLEEEKLIVWRARPVDGPDREPAGTVVERRSDGVTVSCGDGTLLLEEVEMDGTGVLEGELIGDRLTPGERLG
ncbi:MAG TPA: methionyl-tRNA formyltransferase [Actinomycetota bacterium]|jgi:methionyl-tRNA formyltransferase|nr:methionyl-tRNA formyltransferase [Actinomycetota bacterium]